MLDEHQKPKEFTGELNSSQSNLIISTCCEECGLPFDDYGYYPVQILGEDDTITDREFCDLCAQDFLGEEYLLIDEFLPVTKLQITQENCNFEPEPVFV